MNKNAFSTAVYFPLVTRIGVLFILLLHTHAFSSQARANAHDSHAGREFARAVYKIKTTPQKSFEPLASITACFRKLFSEFSLVKKDNISKFLVLQKKIKVSRLRMASNILHSTQFNWIIFTWKTFNIKVLQISGYYECLQPFYFIFHFSKCHIGIWHCK